MITKSQAKRKQDIKTKLMAAIAMLLVSSIMMVSSTYAWFTLSTAPEVTGITTAVGANGNLEMALLPKTGTFEGITSQAGDSTKAIGEKNVTWGNLVDLSNDDVYGLDKITLFPSELNMDATTKTLKAAMLKTPAYGADGRISELLSNTVTGYYDSTAENFAPNDDYGVRAVGTASGMTDRQLDYRNARSTASTAVAAAKNKASQSLNTNGSALANIAIKHGMGSATESYGAADVRALRSIINDLKGTDGVFDQIETAYLQYILAYAASAHFSEDTVWQGVKGAISAEDATLDSVITAMGGTGVLPDGLADAISAYNGANGMVAHVNDADTKLQLLENGMTESSTFTWEQISAAMTPLADTGAMTINGFKASEVKANLGELVSSVTAQGGLTVEMGTGAGVYADIADQCGNYNASVTIERVEYNGIVLNNMNAKMATKTTVSPMPYLLSTAAAVETAKAPASGENTTMPITDMYGYVIDLAFKTNAAESNLMLQVEATDRIYSDNTNEETMGHGSSMTFASQTTDFSNDQVKKLMKAIRIVFFNPLGDNKVIATAKLDAANATVGADGVTAKIYLYTDGATSYQLKPDGEAIDTTKNYYNEQVSYVEATNASGAAAANIKLYTKSGDETNGFTYTEEAYAADSGKTYYTKEVKYVQDIDPQEGDVLYVQVVSNSGETIKTDNVIMPLTQKTAHALSVLVYLDGNLVGNEDVAATASTSMTGSMNLQFASSANLVPMDYAALNIPASNNAADGE